MREIKLQFIIDGKHVTRSYTIEELLDRGITHEHILEDAEGPCTCSLNESTTHCEGDCAQFDKSEVTGKRQFTGLHDKNGKEIYEGDIVTLSGSPHKEILNEFKYIVCFENGSFVCNHQNKEHGRWGLLSRAFDPDIKRLGELSVTGTIYDK